MADQTEFPLKVELPRGRHATLRDPEEVPERLRRPAIDAVEKLTVLLMESGITEEEFAAAAEGDDNLKAAVGIKALSHGARELERRATDLLIVALVQEWSYDGPITVEAVQDLPARTYDVLAKACEELREAMSPDFTPNPDPKSPTRPSSA